MKIMKFVNISLSHDIIQGGYFAHFVTHDA
jgi:hypothetical protein